MSEERWAVVETLDPLGRYSVIAVGDRPRDWASFNRATSQHGISAAARIAKVVQDCVESANSSDTVIEARDTSRLRIIACPILGEYGIVHGVHLWVAPEAVDVGKRRTVAAWEWDAATKLAHHGPGIESDILGVPQDTQRETRTPADFFQRVVRFEQRMSYYDFVSQMIDGATWNGPITILREDGALRELDMFAKAIRNDGLKVCRGLVHDITDVKSPTADLEVASLRAVARADSHPVGLIALNYGAVYEWLNPPHSQLQRWREELPQFHPDDVVTWSNACRSVREGADDVTVVVRLKFVDAAWVRITVNIRELEIRRREMGLLRVIGIETPLDS